MASEVFQKELTYGSESENVVEKRLKVLQVRFLKLKFIIFVGIYFVKTGRVQFFQFLYTQNREGAINILPKLIFMDYAWIMHF